MFSQLPLLVYKPLDPCRSVDLWYNREHKYLETEEKNNGKILDITHKLQIDVVLWVVGRMKKMGGGMMKRPMMQNGGSGKLKMVTNKEGKKVPFYAADGVGKMKKGGIAKLKSWP